MAVIQPVVACLARYATGAGLALILAILALASPTPAWAYPAAADSPAATASR